MSARDFVLKWQSWIITPCMFTRVDLAKYLSNPDFDIYNFPDFKTSIYEDVECQHYWQSCCQFTLCTGQFHVNLTQARAIREKGALTEKMPQDLAAGKSVRHFLSE